jgi:hypothetical protein
MFPELPRVFKDLTCLTALACEGFSRPRKQNRALPV